MINWKNTAENAFIALIFISIGAFIGYTASIQTAKVTTERILKANNEIIMAAVKKQTTEITNNIENSFKTEIKKQKVKGGSQNTTTTNPLLDNTPEINSEIFYETYEQNIPPRPTGLRFRAKKEWDEKYKNNP